MILFFCIIIFDFYVNQEAKTRLAAYQLLRVLFNRFWKSTITQGKHFRRDFRGNLQGVEGAPFHTLQVFLSTAVDTSRFVDLVLKRQPRVYIICFKPARPNKTPLRLLSFLDLLLRKFSRNIYKYYVSYELKKLVKKSYHFF